jgi:hypothetical protein
VLQADLPFAVVFRRVLVRGFHFRLCCDEKTRRKREEEKRGKGYNFYSLYSFSIAGYLKELLGYDIHNNLISIFLWGVLSLAIWHFKPRLFTFFFSRVL